MKEKRVQVITRPKSSPSICAEGAQTETQQKKKGQLLSRDEVHQALSSRFNPSFRLILDIHNQHQREVGGMTENPAVPLIPELPRNESDQRGDGLPRKGGKEDGRRLAFHSTPQTRPECRLHLGNANPGNDGLPNANGVTTLKQ